MRILGVAGFAAFVYGAVRLFRWLTVPRTPLATDDERLRWYDYLRADPEVRKIRDGTVAEFLLAEAKSLVVQKLDSIKDAETKAAAQLGIVGGGIGLLSIFGGKQAAVVPGPLWLILVAALFFLLSVGFNVWCIALGRTDVLPAIEVYNWQDTVRLPEMKARIAHSLTEGYADYSNDLGALSRSKGRLQKVATAVFMAGVIALGANYVTAALRPPHEKTLTFECKGTGSTTMTCKDVSK